MLNISQENFQLIITYTQTEFPKESCGILAGKDGTVVKVYPMQNVADTPVTCYYMAPEEQLRIFKEIRNAGWDMIGIYHSHTHTVAYPSTKDCELAFYPDAVYVIISLADRLNPILRAFTIKDNNIQEISVNVLK